MSAITKPSVQVKKWIVQKYPLTTFFILAIGLTWIFMIADALGSQGILPFRLPLPLMIVMGYMPTLAAVIVTGKTRGRQGVRTLFQKLLIWRVGLRWYLFAFFSLAFLDVFAIVLYNAIVPSADLPILLPNCLPRPRCSWCCSHSQYSSSSPWSTARSWPGAALPHRRYRPGTMPWSPAWSWAY